MREKRSVFVKVRGPYNTRVKNFDEIISTVLSFAGVGLESFVPVAFTYIILSRCSSLSQVSKGSLLTFLIAFENTDQRNAAVSGLISMESAFFRRESLTITCAAYNSKDVKEFSVWWIPGTKHDGVMAVREGVLAMLLSFFFSQSSSN